MKNQKHTKLFILCFHIVAILVYHQMAYMGHFGFDDLHYAKLASHLNQGMIDYNDHYSFRFPILFLTALSYSVFGISDFSSSLPAIFMSTSILVFIYHILKRHSVLTLALALSLTTFSHWFIFYSDKLMPDIYVAFSIVAALFIIHQYKFNSDKKHSIGYAFLLASSLLFGFMSKGTIILILPLLVYLFVIDLLQKRDQKFWLATIISGVLVLVVYFSLTAYLTGDFTKRFEAIASNSYLNLCSYDQQPLSFLLERIGYGFFNLMVSSSIFTAFVFVFAFLFKKRTWEYFLFKDSFSFFLSAAILLFFSSNFMTISPTAYVPMCLDPRHFLFLIPIVAIPTSVIITDFIDKKKYAITIILSLLTVSLWSYFLPENNFWRVYFPLVILFGVYYFLDSSIKYKSLFFGLFVLLLMVKPFYTARYATKLNYNKQKEILTQEILEKYDSCYIITNEVQKRLGDYYLGFDTTQQQQFISYNELNKNKLDGRKTFLLLNWHTRFLSGVDYSELPIYAQTAHSVNPLIYSDSSINLSIYELNSFKSPANNRQLIFEAKNDFEQSVPYWSQDDNLLDTSIQHSGKHSIQTEEYSTTFSYALDSLSYDNGANLIIACNLFCYYLDPTAAELVISIENEEGVYFWKGQPFGKHIKAYGNWWPIQFETFIAANEIKDGSILKIYLWNKGNSLANLDDFEVSIYSIRN